MKRIWPFSFYVVYFGAIAFLVPFLVLYYRSVGLTGTQIGLLTGIAPLITLFSVPVWTSTADNTGWHRWLMRAGLFFSAAGLLIFPLLKTFSLILLAVILFNGFFGPVVAFADSATMFMLGPHRELYGRVRLGGTFGFGLAILLAGVLVENYGLRMAFWGASVLLFAGLAISQKFVHAPSLRREGAGRGQLGVFFKNPHWRLFLLLVFSAGVAFSFLNTYLLPFMQEVGIPESTMGLILTLGTVAEVPMLLFINRLLVRFGAYRLLVLAMAITGLRGLLLAVANTPLDFFAIQMLNAVTFPVLWVAGVAYADEHAPAGMHTSAQGLFSAMMTGVGGAVGGFTGGLLLESVGGGGMYLASGLLVFGTLAVVLILHRQLPAVG